MTFPKIQPDIDYTYLHPDEKQKNQPYWPVSLLAPQGPTRLKSGLATN
jgi:hypothetical protein